MTKKPNPPKQPQRPNPFLTKPQPIPAGMQAKCMHCGRGFNRTEGHVSEEASLCDYCLYKD